MQPTMSSTPPQELVCFDWALKNMLRDKANFDILEGLLSELLKQDITIEEILKSESNRIHEEDKSNRVDLLAKTSNDGRAIIEVQSDDGLDYIHRILYGHRILYSASKLIMENLKKEDSYRSVKKVYSVNILFCNLGDATDYIYVGQTNFLGKRNKKLLGLSPDQKKCYQEDSQHHAERIAGLMPECHFLPEYYLLVVNRFDDNIRNGIDEWIYAIKNKVVLPEFKAKGIQAAGEKLKVLKLNEKERKSYDSYIEKFCTHTRCARYSSL